MFQEPSSLSGNQFSYLMTMVEMILKMLVQSRRRLQIIHFLVSYYHSNAKLALLPQINSSSLSVKILAYSYCRICSPVVLHFFLLFFSYFFFFLPPPNLVHQKYQPQESFQLHSGNVSQFQGSWRKIYIWPDSACDTNCTTRSWMWSSAITSLTIWSISEGLSIIIFNHMFHKNASTCVVLSILLHLSPVLVSDFDWPHYHLCLYLYIHCYYCTVNVQTEKIYTNWQLVN